MNTLTAIDPSLTHPANTATRFCTACGSRTEWRIPADDTRHRAVCPQCATVHYDNPKMVVCALVTHHDRVLLCKRAIEPAYGKWTLPGGFMECGESLIQAAIRETREEAMAQITIDGAVYHIVDIPQLAQTHFFFRAELQADAYGAGEETLEVAWFHPDELPWEHLVFGSTQATLRQWMSDRVHGTYPTRHLTLALESNTPL